MPGNAGQDARGRRTRRRAARAVQYIHARGIIHQYLTLSNVLIDETGRPKLMDFGLSRLRAACLIDPVGPTEARLPNRIATHMTGCGGASDQRPTFLGWELSSKMCSCGKRLSRNRSDAPSSNEKMRRK